MNKSVSELADVMVAFRTVGPNSLDAIMDWLGEHVEKSRLRELASQVRELSVGQALLVSPGWLRTEKVVQIRERETFDSSATPKAGQRVQKVSGHAAKPDLAKYHAKMAATIDKVKADDPKELRKQIAERDVKIRHMERSSASVRDVEKQVPVVDQRAIDRAVTVAVRPYKETVAKLARYVKTFIQHGENIVSTATGMATHLEVSEAEAKETAGPPVPSGERQPAAGSKPVARRPVAQRTTVAVQTDGTLSGVQQRILNGLALFSHLGMVPTRVQLAMHSGYTNPKSPGFTNPLGALRTGGYLDYGLGTIEVKELGRQHGRLEHAPSTLDELRDAWLALLPGVHQRILRQLIPLHHAGGMDRAELAAACGYTNPKSPGFTNPLGRLRTLGLIDYAPGKVFTTDALFPEGLH